MNKEALINQLYSMRAQIDAALFLLHEEPSESKCSHQNRLNLTTMGGPEHWECKSCGFEYKESVD
ncbi:hypothetical protein [Ammoniphilus sp. YIM 78166]|uniref:hypothetical protein n=1 Tax=Ammoniphilus sp. YIM 78166 TaxID=1644106 RepID=UPI00106FEC2D|nr:hypothetical protein [Ammoniphilus sp. YIM 78166]